MGEPNIVALVRLWHTPAQRRIAEVSATMTKVCGHDVDLKLTDWATQLRLEYGIAVQTIIHGAMQEARGVY